MALPTMSAERDVNKHLHLGTCVSVLLSRSRRGGTFMFYHRTNTKILLLDFSQNSGIIEK